MGGDKLMLLMAPENDVDYWLTLAQEDRFVASVDVGYLHSFARPGADVWGVLEA